MSKDWILQRHEWQTGLKKKKVQHAAYKRFTLAQTTHINWKGIEKDISCEMKMTGRWESQYSDPTDLKQRP